MQVQGAKSEIEQQIDCVGPNSSGTIFRTRNQDSDLAATDVPFKELKTVLPLLPGDIVPMLDAPNMTTVAPKARTV